MTSFVRRSVRTTALAAGVAALGAGLAGPAFAATDVPVRTNGMATDTQPTAAGPRDLVTSAPTDSDQARDVPAPFSFQAPSYDTAGPDAGSPDAQRTVSHATSHNSVSPDGTNVSAFDRSPDSAMSRLDTARAMGDLAQR